MSTAKSILRFFLDLVHSRKAIYGLAKNDFKAKFAGSFLGIIWAFVQPLITLLVFWFVFQVGFKSTPVSDTPFIVWFTPAYLAWSFFSEALISGTNCLSEYSYLVKKVNFRVSTIPVVKILSSAFVHLGFIVFVFILLAVYGIPFSIYNLQVIYYFACTCLLLVGLCWLLSAIAPFLKDTVNIVNVFIQIGFWVTPIFWNSNEMNPVVQMVLKLNPMFYICRGYRDCFIDHIWFWQQGYTNLYFWGVTVFLFVLGAYTFRKLRPQFADVI